MADKINWDVCSMCGEILPESGECSCCKISMVGDIRARLYHLQADPELIGIINDMLTLIEEK